MQPAQRDVNDILIIATAVAPFGRNVHQFPCSCPPLAGGESCQLGVKSQVRKVSDLGKRLIQILLNFQTKFYLYSGLLRKFEQKT